MDFCLNKCRILALAKLFFNCLQQFSIFRILELSDVCRLPVLAILVMIIIFDHFMIHRKLWNFRKQNPQKPYFAWNWSQTLLKRYPFEIWTKNKPETFLNISQIDFPWEKMDTNEVDKILNWKFMFLTVWIANLDPEKRHHFCLIFSFYTGLSFVNILYKKLTILLNQTKLNQLTPSE